MKTLKHIKSYNESTGNSEGSKVKIKHKKIVCLECNSTIQYDDVDVKDNGYEYFFGHQMNSKLLYIECPNCHKLIFLDGNTRMPKWTHESKR